MNKLIIKFWEKQISSFKLQGKLHEVAETFLRIAELYEKLNDSKLYKKNLLNSINFLKQESKILKDYDDIRKLAQNYENIAELYLKTQDIKNAHKYYLNVINIAKDYHIAKKFSDIKVDTSDVLSKVREVIQNVYEGETPEKLEKDRIDLVKGFAKFVDKNILDVNGNKIKAKKIIISTGSSPFIPPIKGIDEVNFLTNENIFNLEKLQKNIIVLGGGAIGV